MPGYLCSVCGEWVPGTVHACAGRRTVPLLIDPHAFGLDDPGRLGALSTVNERTRSALVPGGVLVYPGSGDDIANALFATYSRIQFFVFVDTWQGSQSDSLESITDSLALKLPRTALPKRISALALAQRLGLRTSTGLIGFEFSFNLQKRYLLFVKSSVEAFLGENQGFGCDVFFVKDFAGTSSDITFDMVLPCLRPNGLYVSNALGSFDVPFLPMFGLRFVVQTAMVGFSEMIVCQKQRALQPVLLRLAYGRIVDAQKAVTTYFGDADDTYDLLSKSFQELKPVETEVLAAALESARKVLDDGTLPNDLLFEMCAACVRKNAWVGGWNLGSARLNQQAYEAAWVKRHMDRQNQMLMSRPKGPSGRRPPTRRRF